MKSLYSILLCLSLTTGFCQQEPQFSQYMMNPNLWNPSYSAVKQQTTFSLHHRTQWLGYTNTDNNPSVNPPSTQVFTATTALRKIKSGIGFGLMNDMIGPLTNQHFYLSYSYYLNIGEGKLAAGAGVGAQSISVNTGLWRAEDPNDPTLVSAGTLRQLKPNFRWGLSYTTDKLFIGLSSVNVASPVFTFNQSDIRSSLIPHFYLQGAYRLELTENVSLQPSVLLKRSARISSAEISNLLLFRNFWAGLSYRTGDALIMIAGLDIFPDKSLKAGYNFDLTVINAKAKAVSSHEIFLSYNLSAFLDNRKPVIRSPRFRF